MLADRTRRVAQAANLRDSTVDPEPLLSGLERQSDRGRGKRRGHAMDCNGLTVEVRQEPELTLITVAGEVDIATVPVLREGLAGPTASGKPIIVELDAVSFI